MFICRFQLPRAYAPKRLPSSLVLLHLNPSLPHIPIPKSHVHTGRTSTQTPDPTNTKDSAPSEPHSSTDRLSLDDKNTAMESLHDASIPPDTTARTVETPEGNSTKEPSGRVTSAAMPENSNILEKAASSERMPQYSSFLWRSRAHQSSENSPINTYFKMRKTSSKNIATLPLAFMFRILSSAQALKREDVFNPLITDAVRVYCGQSADDRRVFIFKLLETYSSTTLIQRQLLVPLLRLLRNTKEVLQMSTTLAVSLSETVMQKPDNHDVDVNILELVALPLLARVAEHPKELDNPRREFCEIVWVLFRMLHNLLQHQEPRKAMRIFKPLVNTSSIIANAVDDVAIASGDFEKIVRSGIIHTCIKWGWYDRVRNMYVNALAYEEIDPALGDLAVYLIRQQWTRVRSSKPDERAPILQQTSALITMLMGRGNTFIVPEDLLQEFYQVARRWQMPKLMESVYQFSQKQEVTEKHVYPPPGGVNLFYFLEYLLMTSKNQHLARLLSRQVLDERVVVPLQDRSAMIATLASNGLATYARALYEHYADRRDKEFVVGNMTVVTRLVSLYVSRVRKLQADFERQTGLLTNGILTPLPAFPDSRPQFSAEHREQLASTPVISASTSAHEEGRIPDPGLRDSVTVLEDYQAFITRVVAEFRRERAPYANHFELTTLARVYFMLGNGDEGFAMFKLMLERKQIPDIHDVNVALSWMSQYSPSRAAAMIERMVKEGIKPDAVTFGTVIHHAILDDNIKLVNALLRRARELDIRRLTYKTLGALIRGVLTMSISGRGSPGQKVQSFIDAMLDAGYVPTPKMGRDCIIATLRSGDPLRAFRYWQLLVRDKVEWWDSAQWTTRRRIAYHIRQHALAGNIARDRARLILSQLGESVEFHVRGRPKGIWKTSPRIRQNDGMESTGAES